MPTPWTICCASTTTLASSTATPTAPPGTKFIYSDVGFIVLGELVRRVSGKSVHDWSDTVRAREIEVLSQAAQLEGKAASELAGALLQ